MKKKIHKHVILAGTPRAGKTTVCLKLLKYGFVHYKMDSIKRGICEIFHFNQHNWNEISPMMARLIQVILKENKTDTVAFREYYVIDSCHLLPKDLSLIEEDVLVVYLGYADIDCSIKLKEMRKHDKKYFWSHQLSDEELIQMIDANIKLSQYYREECQKYHFIYFDTSFHRDEVLQEVVQFIIDHCKESN